MYESVAEHKGSDGKPLVVFDRRFSNKRALDFAEADSRFYIGSARGEHFGHGQTIQKAHCTEFARWPESAGDLFIGILGAAAYGEVALESTANGAYGRFHEIWQEQRAGPGRSIWEGIFFRWFEDPQYVLPCSPEEAAAISEEVWKGEGSLFAAEERELCDRLHRDEGIDLSPEQLKWRRDKRREFGARFAEQFPEDDITCFLTSGRTFFDARRLDEIARSCCKPPLRQEGQGEVWIWEEPIAGRGYILSADVGQGETVGEDSDFSTISITDRDSGDDVLEYMGRCTPDILAKLIAEYGRRYNEALACPERNGHGFTVIARLKENHYQGGLWRDQGGDAGWSTSAKNRGPMLDDLEEALRKGLYQPRSARFIEQARSFVVRPDGRPAAAPGCHDDLVIDKAINWAVRQRLVRRFVYAEAI